MSKPGKVLKALCKKLGVRLTVKQGKKRVYKRVKVLKRQCANKKKKKVKKKVKRKRRRKFGTKRSASKMDNLELNPKYYKYIKLLHDNNNLKNDTFDKEDFFYSLIKYTEENIDYLREHEPLWLQKLYNLGMRDFEWIKIRNGDLKEGMVLRNCMLYFDPTDYFYITNVDFTSSTFLINNNTEKPVKYDLNADLNQCNFNECNLRNYVFVAQIIDCSFQGADLTGTDFSDSSFSYGSPNFPIKEAFNGAIYNTKKVVITIWVNNKWHGTIDEKRIVNPTRFPVGMERKGITPSRISTMEENNKNEENENGIRLRVMKGYIEDGYKLVVGKKDRWGSDEDEDVDMGGTVESKGGNFGKKRKRKIKKKVKKKVKRKRKKVKKKVKKRKRKKVKKRRK